MTSAEAAVLVCAHAYAAAMQAEAAARTTYKLSQRAPGTPAPKAHALNAAMLTAEDATRDARSALTRAAKALTPQESKFDVIGAP